MSTNRPWVMLSLTLAMLLAAIEATIVATAMPDIVASLGGFALFGWVFSAYLLMQAVTTPLFGKLADVYGRKPVFIGGMLSFLLGSVLCALAPTMHWLIAFRLLQGVGAGAVVPIAVTLAGDLYTLAERGKVQAALSSVWGISSVVGPLAGGLIVAHWGWPWIFWLNLPIGLLSAGLMLRFLHEERRPRIGRLDWLGAILLLTSLTSLMLALTLSGGWLWPLLITSLLALGWFIHHEARVDDPVVHLDLWRQPLVWRGNLSVLMLGIGMLGLIAFLPTYVQGVHRGSALQAGFAMSAMCVGWPLAAMTTGQLLLRVRVRPLVRCGGLLAVAGAALIALQAPAGAVWIGIGSCIVGVGFGMLNTSFIVSIQTSVPWEKRGVATAGNMLMRNLGNALGTAALGALLNRHLGHYIRDNQLQNQVSLDSLRSLIGEGAEQLDPKLLELLRGGLAEALGWVLWAIFGSIVLCAAIAWMVPDLRLSSRPSDFSEL